VFVAGDAPNTCADPSLGASSPTAMRRNVVLPAPFGPISAITLPSGMDTVQSRSAQVRRP
jgi:hypothetical protein